MTVTVSKKDFQKFAELMDIFMNYCSKHADDKALEAIQNLNIIVKESEQIIKPAVFYFSFMCAHGFGEDETNYLNFGFNITKTGVAKIAEKYGSYENFEQGDALYDDFCEPLESEYGVHDWGSSPSDEVYGIGYHTYEVEKHLIPELMNKWRDVFVELCGNENVSQVVALSGDSGSDFEIYNEILNKAGE
jgi:hypothetical protein